MYCDFKCANFKHILGIGILSIQVVNIALKWMPEDLINEKSTSAQTMASCHKSTSHNLNQSWPIYMSPDGVLNGTGILNNLPVREEQAKPK